MDKNKKDFFNEEIQLTDQAIEALKDHLSDNGTHNVTEATAESGD